jgi:hypothetical protein
MSLTTKQLFERFFADDIKTREKEELLFEIILRWEAIQKKVVRWHRMNPTGELTVPLKHQLNDFITAIPPDRIAEFGQCLSKAQKHSKFANQTLVHIAATSLLLGVLLTVAAGLAVITAGIATLNPLLIFVGAVVFIPPLFMGAASLVGLSLTATAKIAYAVCEGEFDISYSNKFFNSKSSFGLGAMVDEILNLKKTDELRQVDKPQDKVLMSMQPALC